MTLYTLTIHLQTDDIASVLEPLARHLEHIEVAIDYEGFDGSDMRAHPDRAEYHPVVALVDEADRDAARAVRKAKKAQSAFNARLERQAKYKREARAKMSRLSPLVIDAVPCPTCHALIKQPCRSPGMKGDFGRTGHTHLARREAYATKAKP